MLRRTVSLDWIKGLVLGQCVALMSCSPSPETGTVSPTGERPFTVSSLGEGYPMTGEARGVYWVDGDTLFVTVTRGRFRNNLLATFGDSGVLRDLRLRAGIGIPTETGWRVASRSTEAPVVSALAPQQEARFEQATFTVPIVEGAVLRDGWLHFALIGSHGGLFDREPGNLSSYMCQTENLSGPTEESRARAEGMVRAYTKIC